MGILIEAEFKFATREENVVKNFHEATDEIRGASGDSLKYGLMLSEFGTYEMEMENNRGYLVSSKSQIKYKEAKRMLENAFGDEYYPLVLSTWAQAESRRNSGGEIKKEQSLNPQEPRLLYAVK